MAADRAALESCDRGEFVSPRLRVYQWSPPAVSLGYHQDENSLDHTALRAAGIDVVRRPTGGSAVLHHQEYTYSVVGPLGFPGLGRGYREIYDSLAGVLVAALRALDVPAERASRAGSGDYVCFSASAGHEIAVAGRKLVGSAFRRGRRAFLQHGSLLTGSAHTRLVEFMPDGGLDRDELAARTTDLAALGHGEISAQAFAVTLADHLSQRLAIPWATHGLAVPTRSSLDPQGEATAL